MVFEEILNVYDEQFLENIYLKKLWKVKPGFETWDIVENTGRKHAGNVTVRGESE